MRQPIDGLDRALRGSLKGGAHSWGGGEGVGGEEEEEEEEEEEGEGEGEGAFQGDELYGLDRQQKINK